MKRISLEELLKGYTDITYEQQAAYIMGLLSAGKIKPLKASKTNGKKPVLFREYWLIEDKKNYEFLEEELKYRLHAEISVDYYLRHLEVYEQEREWVKMLDTYLKSEYPFAQTVSVNERSFEIWNREKFLSRELGKRVLKHCGFRLEQLKVYQTSEPLSYYTGTRTVPQDILILENKDTFYSMRQYLINTDKSILGKAVGTLVYGAGKRILRSFDDFIFCVEPYMRHPDNQIYYFGDMDYEGIGIYERLAEMFSEHIEIRPFLPAYIKMLQKAEKANLPLTKEQQNRNMRGTFFSYFSEQQVQRMKEILESDTYIPQEIITILDF